jgi:hypothetical protein
VSLQAFVTELNTFGEYLGGPFIVALFYWFRFHTLDNTRSYTTLFLYSIGAATFVLPFLLIYFAIYYTAENAQPLQHCAPDVNAMPAACANGISAASVICVVMLVWLVPALPKWWRDFCQSVARIPFYAYTMRSRLSASTWELPDADWPDISRKLARVGYQVDDLRALQSAPIQARFLKIAAIMYHLEKWKLEGNLFLDRNLEHYSDLLAVYDLLSFKLTRALKNSTAIYGAVMEDSKVEPDDWRALDSFSAKDDSSSRLQSAAQTAAGCMLEDLRKDMDFHLDHLLLLTARCALASEWSFAGRKRRIEAMGFTLEPPNRAILWMVLAGIGISVATVLVWLVAVRHLSDFIPGNVTAGVTRAFVMSPLHIIVSILIIYHLKRSYAFANEGVFGGFPIKFILSIGFLTALLMSPVQAVFDHYQFPERDYGPTLMHELPVLLYMWVTGTVIALLVQDSMWSSFDSRLERQIMDGTVLGVTFVFAVALLFAINAVFPIPVMERMAQARAETGALAFVGLIFGFSFVGGFVLGFVLIAPVRQAASLRFARDELKLSGAFAGA